MLDAVGISVILQDDGVAKKAEQVFRENDRLKLSFDGELRSLLDFENQFREYKALFRKASAPHISKIIGTHAGALTVDSWTGDQKLWDIYQENHMKSRQDFVFRDALTYGYSYVAVLPDEEKEETAVIIPMSARNTYAKYSRWEDHPDYVLQKIDKKNWIYIDDEAVYTIEGTPSNVEQVYVNEHYMGYCPVVRIDEKPVDDNTTLPEAPFKGAITTAQALTECRFHIGMVGRHASWPRMWATGLELDEEAADIFNEMQANGLFASSSELSKFGNFQQADMNGLNTIKQGIQADLAFLTSTPVHHLASNGTIANIGAEALASLQNEFYEVADRRKASMSEGLNKVFRIISEIVGSSVDPSETVHWDTKVSYSLSQVGDFIVKLDSVGLDIESAVQMIPGWDQAQVRKAIDYKLQHQKASDAIAVVSAIEKKADTARKLVDLGVSPEDALREVQLDLEVQEPEPVPPALANFQPPQNEDESEDAE